MTAAGGDMCTVRSGTSGQSMNEVPPAGLSSGMGTEVSKAVQNMPVDRRFQALMLPLSGKRSLSTPCRNHGVAPLGGQDAAHSLTPNEPFTRNATSGAKFNRTASHDGAAGLPTPAVRCRA